MRKKIIINLLLIIFILSISFGVNASSTDKYDIVLSANNTKVKPGDAITISLKVDNINIQSGEKGIGAYEGTLLYDSNVFEEVTIKGNDNWDTPALNEGRFTSVKSNGECTNVSQEIASITLKVKENATSGSTKIQIKDFEASNGQENITTADKDITLTIEAKKDNSDGNNTIVDDNNTVKDDNNTIIDDNKKPEQVPSGSKDQSSNKNSSMSANENKSSSQNKLPYAGISETLVIVILIVIVGGIFSYIKYKRTY